jgi:ribosomal protein L32
MGVKCSLLGHDYGDSEVERERDEEGNEVVRTAKRVERCQNCGHTRTISANTEVMALEAAAGVVREPDGTVVAATDGSTTEEIEGNVVIESTDDDDRPATAPAEADAVTAPAEADAATAPVEADAATAPVEADAATAPAEAKSASAPEPEDGIESNRDDRPAASAIDRIERNSEPPQSARAPGEWPAEPDTVTDGRGSSVGGEAAVGWPDGSDGTVEGSDESEETASGKRRTRRPGDTLSCGSCGFASPVADSPLRAGDICPDCGTGYLAWETRKG